MGRKPANAPQSRSRWEATAAAAGAAGRGLLRKTVRSRLPTEALAWSPKPSEATRQFVAAHRARLKGGGGSGNGQGWDFEVITARPERPREPDPAEQLERQPWMGSMVVEGGVRRGGGRFHDSRRESEVFGPSPARESQALLRRSFQTSDAPLRLKHAGGAAGSEDEEDRRTALAWTLIASECVPRDGPGSKVSRAEALQRSSWGPLAHASLNEVLSRPSSGKAARR
ncbi:hypothetical protein H632_c2182p0 [Helicosporidium sp. ATCC 50920]|nr:hypothetical protein H632_c2182p0 [Helicosporidium sp. ATCC 50920]|eukprot:KDD73433.1 hypothetical protein H632_c2182p0 [Helicosporidium sp. ATCC 50920]